MRIIRGTHQGRRVLAPAKLQVRPTTDYAKEGLFNILENHYYFDELLVLDLFAGIGSISYEFASRGSLEVITIDANHRCVKFIKETALDLQLDKIKVIRSTAMGFLKFTHQQFNIIFADPPFDFSESQLIEIITIVFEKKLLLDGGALIIEHSRDKDFSSLEQFQEKRKYGKVNFSFFRA